MPDTVTLKPNQPVTLKVPTITVTGMDKPGAYTFQLIVTDESGIASDPVTWVVNVTPG
jgi:hypothetical protein